MHISTKPAAVLACLQKGKLQPQQNLSAVLMNSSIVHVCSDCAEILFGTCT